MDQYEPDVIAFVEFYIQEGFKAAPAYRMIRPDVKDNTSWTEGAKFLRKPEVQEYLKLRLEDMKAGAEETVVGITEIARDPSSSRKEKLQALNLLGKVHGLFIDKSEVNVKGEMTWKQFIAPQDGKDSGSEDGNSDTNPT